VKFKLILDLQACLQPFPACQPERQTSRNLSSQEYLHVCGNVNSYVDNHSRKGIVAVLKMYHVFIKVISKDDDNMGKGVNKFNGRVFAIIIRNYY
jgi:hypothetical protein